MIEAMFEIYDFIVKNNLEVHYIEKPKEDNEIIVFISPAGYREFATIMVKHFIDLLGCGDYQGTITSNGAIGVNIMPLIEHYCMIEDAELWETRYKQIGGC